VTFARQGRDGGSIAPRTAQPPRRRHTAFARLVGAVGLVALTALLYWMLTDEAFTVSEERVAFRGLTHADEAEVRALLGDIERGPNVFRVRVSDIVAELSTLTEVDAASAVVTLPADVSVTLDERDPIFIWSDDAVSWLVDERGMLFAPADRADEAADAPADGPTDGADEPDASGAAAEGDTAAAAGSGPRGRLPRLVDARLPEEAPTEGTYLSPIDLAAMRQLLALDSELLGSRANEFDLRVDDEDGYVLESLDLGWRALFGHYTLTLQPPDVIPAQVQCLRSLLAAREQRLERVRLAVTADSCGTFTLIDNEAAGGG